MRFRRIGARAMALAGLTLAAGLATAAPSSAVHQTVTGLTTGNQLVQFAVGSPQALISGPLAVGGVAGDLIGIDYRPKTGTLYGVNDAGQVYLITPTPVVAGSGPSEPAASFAATPIGTPGTDPNNVDSGVDFNPIPDAIRVVNTDDQNLRLNVNTGGLILADGGLAFAGADTNAGDNPVIGAAGYTNSFDGATTTTLFDIEAGNNILATQIPPNDGTLNTVGPLGLDVTPVAGLDIEPFTNNTAYAALQAQGDASSRFYRVNTTTGSAGTALGTGAPFIGGGIPQLVESVSLVPTSTLGFVNAVTSVSENGPTAQVVLTRTGPLNQQATVNYATSSAAGDGAAAGTDYTATNGTLTFAQGDAMETISVPVADDSADEADEQFTITLTAPSRSANVAGTPPFTTKVAIIDEDDAPAATTNAGAPQGLISVVSQRVSKSIKAKFLCDQACVASLTLKLGGKTVDERSAVQALDDGANDVAFALSKKELKKAKKKAKGKKAAKFQIDGTFSDADGSTTSTVKFQVG